MDLLSRLSQKIVGAYRFIKTHDQHLPLAAKAIFNVSCTVVKIRGSIRGGDNSVVLLYVGRQWNDGFFLDLFFQSHEIISCESASLFTAQRRCHALARDADIEVNDVGWPYGGRFNKYQDCLEFADWVNMILPLEDQWTDVVRSFRKSTRNNDLRLIRRNQYRFEATNDPESIESFYDTMYLPSARLRHGAASIVAPKKHVLKRARQGKLLQIYKGDQLVIAGVVYPEDDVLYFLWQGSPPDFQERPAEGAASALYYFGIRYAFDNELSAVDFAGTRAFLDFGDFRFKRKWGAFVDDSFSPNSVFLRPLNSRPGTIAFCERFPLIARSDDGLEAVIVSRDKTVDTDTLVHMGKNYDCEGLARFVIVGVSEQTRPSMRVEELDGREYRVIQCRPEQFTSVYVARSLANR